ncbi:MAG: hypothetical protein RL607_1407 [Bacteroidota bacterium]
MKNKLLLVVLGTVLTAQALVAQVPSYVPTNGLVGYWPFSGNANDASGNGNNGTVNGSTQLSSDRFSNNNSSYIWDGSNSPITVANNLNQNFSNGVTFSVWIYQTGMYCSSCVATNYITKGRNIDNGGLTIGLDHTNQKFYFQVTGNPISTNPPFSIFYSESNIIYNNWTLLTGTYDGNTIKIYVNGVLDKSYSYISSVPINNDNILFGKQKGTSVFADNFNMLGKLDDIVIWNRALTQQEITNLYNASLPQTACLPANVPTSGLVGYWPFCGNANDESGNGNNGTNNGATLTTDRFGNANSAYSFDGVDDYIQVPNSNSISITGDITMAAWVNTLGYNNQNYQTILSKRETYWTWEYAMGLSYHTGIVHDTKLIASRALGMGNQQQVWSTNSYIPNNWEYWVATISNGQLKLYKNGVLDNTQPYTLVPNNQNCPLLFGKNTLADTSEQFLGKLDDIGIWNRALTPQEITNLYNANQCLTTITVTDTLIINVGQLSFTNPVTWANNITIAPNPASTQININFNNITDLTGGSINIINALGQSVATTPITASGTNTTLSLATWGGTGMYFVQIINAQGQIVDIKKIILQ